MSLFFDNLNQYTQTQDAQHTTQYTYDSNGNLSGDGTWVYAYDYENRLTSATKSGTTAAYKYDAFGRRIQKEVTQGAQHTTHNYIYDGDQVIAEYDSSGILSKKYVYGLGIDEPILLDNGTNKYYYHFDGLGSVTEITNSSGSVAEKYEYDAYGKTTIKDASDNVLTQSAIGNSYGFTGRELDSETGLYYYRARYYSPGLGRFLQRDPVGYTAGINLYTYCSNNPINWVDPSGLDKQNKDKPWLEQEAIQPFPWWQEVGFWTTALLAPKVVMAGLSAGESTVLYYGPSAWKLAAASSGIPIFKTFIGRAMNNFESVFGINLPRIMWDAASAIYAAGARGTVQVFTTLSEYSADYSSTFYRIEAPIIEFLGKSEIVFK
ncbi:MAG: RHS repeat-associated core domain-containing protein [Planctomycetota bacterium]